MDKLVDILIEMFPLIALNMDTDKLLDSKPKGFAPIRKRECRVACGKMLSQYEDILSRKNSRKRISSVTLSRINRLKKEARL